VNKSPKPDGIPLEFLIGSTGFDRNLAMLERDRPRLERMLWDEKVLAKLPPDKREAAKANARKALSALDTLKKTVLENAQANIATRRNQAERAKGPRVKNSDGRTLADVVAAVANAHPDSAPREVWPHLATAIEEWAGRCDEVRTSAGVAYRYDLGGNDRTLSYRHFSDTLRDLRKR
jgi:hypothetical protein